MNDLKFAFRQLLRNPGFTAVAVVSLALGIGAGTAVFSLVNAILLRSLPVPNPHELRVLPWTGSDVRMPSINEWPIQSGSRWAAYSVSHPAFRNLREQGTALADIFGFQPLEDITARVRSEAFTARGMMVSDNFFSGLGVRPVIGRVLNAEEDFTSVTTSVVIAHEWWEKYFARDPGVIGQVVVLNGTSFTIVGVLPSGLTGVVPGDPMEFYVPMAAQSQFLYKPITETFYWFVRLMARLRPGVSDAQLRATLNVAFAREAGAVMNEPKMLVEPGNGGLGTDRDNYRRPLLLMLGVVGLVMLVACANLAGLSLARGAARQHELAVRAAFYEQVQNALAAIPGVRGAALLESPLLSDAGSSAGFVFPDSSAAWEWTYTLIVGETFFPTMGIPVLQGRGLSSADTEGAPKVVVVNETFVRKYSSDKNPLGRTVRILDADWRIVGVCRDAKFTNIKEAAPPTTYLPFRQRFYGVFRRTVLGNASFAVRAALPPLSLTTSARKAVAAINPGVPLAHVTTQAAMRGKNIGQERLLATLCGALAGLALLLSCIGLYGLMAYQVARRTSEIAIRMALGAQRGDIAGPILREALILAGIGVSVGLPAVFAVTRFIKNQLYGVQPDDPLTLVLVIVALVTVALLAAWLPARRAARVEPMTALRAE
jgi:hypothetical protein